MASSELTELSGWTRLRRLCWHWTRPAYDFLFPPACLVCHGPVAGAAFCDGCRIRLSEQTGPKCQRCAAPCGPHLDTATGCVYCRKERYVFRRVLAWGLYDGLLQQTILQAKMTHGRPLAMALADLLLDDALPDLLTEPFDAVVPVPHDWQRRVWQLHTPSETIAERLASRLDRRFLPQLLSKPRPTPRQAAAPPSVRRRQQKGAFVVPEQRSLAGARLLLVDDVMTTGATAQAATQALLAAGAADIIVAVIARGLGKSAGR